MQGNNATLKYLASSVIILAACLVNIPLLQTIWIHGFDDGTYSHAFLIPFISAYLLYTSVKEGRVALRNRPSLLWLLATVLAGLLLYISAKAQISLGYWGAWLIMLCCAVPVIFRFSLTIIFPFAYLIFLLPVWGTLSGLLQTLSVVVVSGIMGLTGIPVYVESVFVQIPAGTFEIADGCSGLRYMIVSLAIATIYIFMFVRSTSSAIKLLLLAIVGALITNWLRIAGLIVIGHMTDMQSSLMEDHNMFGWYLYIPFMFIFYYVGNKLSTGPNDVPAAKPEEKAGGSLYIGLAAIIVIMGASGTSLSHTMMTHTDIPRAENAELQPTVFFASDIEQQTVMVDGNRYQQLRYYFSGRTLDGKPSYYENQLVPDNWQVADRHVMNDYVQLIVRNPRGDRMAEIRYTYWFAGERYPRLGQLKKARIKRAVLSSAETRIDWMWRACNKQCVESLASD